MTIQPTHVLDHLIVLHIVQGASNILESDITFALLVLDGQVDRVPLPVDNVCARPDPMGE